ncbi:MAG: ATP-binding protein [Ktedonobacteraceae bacterium]
MSHFDVPLNHYEHEDRVSLRQSETYLEHQHEILHYITDIGSSLRLQMDTDTLLKSVSEAACKGLHFQQAVLYLSDGKGYFRACAISGDSEENEKYLRQHPLPDDVVAQLINQQYRVSESYFIPAEAPLWQNHYVTSFFVAGTVKPSLSACSDQNISQDPLWRPEDLLVVPLVSGDNILLGFLTPDSPLDGLRPTTETMALLELFANQAAVVIEGTKLYEEARQSSEERAALIEIGRVLSTPEAQRDLQTVYQTIYEQVRRVMPADAFFITRYNSASDKMVMDYLVDEDVLYPSFEYQYVGERTRDLLFHGQQGWLFSTADEYKQFLKDSDLIGEERPSQSFLYIPIRYGTEPIGMLSAQNYQPHAYTQRHLEMLKEIGVQAGIAITNARLNTELRSALKKAQESERLKNHFLMTASHELRTPLTAIQGYIELLSNFNSVLDEDSKVRFLSNARRACDELVLLLGNVMDTSSIDQDRVSLNLGAVQVLYTVQLILEILEPTIAREGRPVEVKIPEDLYVNVDDLRLRQILLNIVGNALKYTPASAAIEITATCVDRVTLAEYLSSASQQDIADKSGCFAVIVVKDRGPGISMEDQARLFSKFMRLESAMNSIQRGAGLGLYLCRQLVEAMGGCIWLESQGIPGEGSTFAIALPVYKNEKS